MQREDEQKPSGFHQYASRVPLELDKQLNNEITSLYYKQAPFVSISLIFILIVIYYFLQHQVPQNLLLLWTVINLVFSLALLLTSVAYNNRSGNESSGFWLGVYVVLMVCQDLSFGLIGPMTAIVTDEIYRFLILFILAGSAAGAITTRGILFKLYVVSITLQLAPITITFMISDRQLAGAMMILTMVFYAFMLFVDKNYSSSIRNSISLWLNLQSEIEARKESEVKLLEAKRRAEVANEAKNHFLASVSHELRTPLNGILGFSAALNKSPLNDTDKDYVEQIDHCSKNLLSMVNDILDITTIEAGGLELHDYPFSLSSELKEVAALAQRLAEDKGLQFSYRMAEEVPQYLRGDGQRVKQVINNLISNAIKYTEEGSVALSVQLDSLDDNRARLRFKVEDTGIGIAQSAHATLFDTFTRGSDGKARYDGVGLGLSIVKSLLQQMGGEISFESEVGKGSRFEAVLPFEVAQSQTVDSDALAEGVEQGGEVAPEADEELARIHMLIVDDNDVNRLVIKTFIEPYHIPYSEAVNGEQALQLLADKAFDLVLLDINMPGVSGIEVRSNFQHSSGPIPYFVAVTAHALSDEVEEIMAAGFDECLIKPVSEDELIGVIKRVAASR